MPHPGTGFPIPPSQWPHVGRQWPQYNIESDQAADLMAWWPTLASQGGSFLRELVGGRLGNGIFGGINTITWITDAVRGWGIDLPNVAGGDAAGSARVEINTIGAMTAGTVSVWAILDALPAENFATLFAHSDWGAGARLYFRVDSSGNISIRLGTSAATTRGTVAANKLNCLTLTWDSGSAYVYKNGVQQGAIYNYTGIPGSNNANSAWGAYYVTPVPQHVFDGQLFDMRLYNRALASSRVSQIYDLPTRWELHQIPRRLWRLGVVAPPPPTIVPVAMHHYRSARL